MIGLLYSDTYQVDGQIETPTGTSAEVGDVAPAGEFWSPYVLK